MRMILGLLKNRTRLPRPKRPMSVPADLNRQYRFMARCFFVFGIAGFGYGLYERSNYAEAMARPPSSVVALLSPQGVPIKTIAADSMAEDEWHTVARAVAAQHVVRMRRVTHPIDFTLGAVEEGRFWVKDVASIKLRNWLSSRPFDELAKRRQQRVVLLEDVIATIRPGNVTGDKVLVTVQWPERIEANGSTQSAATHGGEIIVERVRNVSPEIARHNPIGAFVFDYSFDTAN